MNGLLERRLLFVSGKGGVGKTTVAAGLARLAADRGARVLVCEIDARGDLAAAFGHPRRIGFEPVPVHPRVWAMAMDTEASLREYLQLNLRLPAAVRLGPLARTLDFVADAAPGVREILAVGKLAWEVRERHYDLVVVDAPSSGHVVGHLAAPSGIDELLGGGLVRSQTGWMLELLGDPAVTGLVVVALPEEMPVVEALELIDAVRARTVVEVAAVVANRVLPEPFTRADEALFQGLGEPDAQTVLRGVVGAGVADVWAGARLAADLRRGGSVHLERLRAAVGELPVLFLPERFDHDSGPGFLAAMVEALSEEL